MTNRREFLKTATVAAFGAPLVFSPFVQRRNYSCIIIGAGLSGLAAAHALKEVLLCWQVTSLRAGPRELIQRLRCGVNENSYRWITHAALPPDVREVSDSPRPRRVGAMPQSGGVAPYPS